MKNIGKGSTGGPFQKQEKWANKTAVQRNQRAEGRAPRSWTHMGNRQTKPASRGKSALQLNANEQLSNGVTKVPREEKSAWEPSENEQLPNELMKPARKRSSGWEPDKNEQHWSARAKARWREWNPTDEPSPEGTPVTADEIIGTPSLQPDEYLHNRGWADPENLGLHHEEWAQEEMAAFHRFEENLRHYHCVVCKPAWPLYSPARRDDSYTCSRFQPDKKPCRLYSADNDMDPGSVPAELQGLSEVEELLTARAFPIMFRRSTRIQGTRTQSTSRHSGFSK